MDDDMFLELLCAGVSHQDESGADSIPTDSDMSDGNDIFHVKVCFLTFVLIIDPLSANPTKWSGTLKQNCLSLTNYFKLYYLSVLIPLFRGLLGLVLLKVLWK